MATIIQQESQRLSRLVDNLLDLSRLEAGAAEPRVAWTSIEDVIRAALADLAPGEQDFSLAIDRDMPLVSVDPVQMERAFVNVLENARRHSGGHPVSVRARAVRSFGGPPTSPPPTPPGEGRVGEGEGTADVTPATPAPLPTHDGPAGDRLMVRIVDRGPGIPPAQLERVFEPFYRAGTPQGGHRGSGLGLAIARGFTESNGGRLHVESLPGQGATFVFELPLAPAEMAAASGGEIESPSSPEHVS
jgi:two-component system sensor histidine kinase KdpD